MQLPILDPLNAKLLFDRGAILVDIREADEHVREQIPGAHHLPLSKLDETALAVHGGQPVIFHCRSGARTTANALRLAGKVSGACQAFIIQGGLEAWKKAGLPVIIDRHQPIELQRQMQIVAGSLALIGTALSLLVSPWFFTVPALVGAGLITAGATGFCSVTWILTRMPWNRAIRCKLDWPSFWNSGSRSARKT
jgi:rhodanese-related sulfurtransferase